LRRTQVLILIGFGVFVFLGISALLARALEATSTERGRVLAVARAEARGDARAVLAATPACAAQAACAVTTRTFVAHLKRPGDVQILQYLPSVQMALTRQTNTARVAWRAGLTGLPVVQCVRITRDGPLTGADVQLLSISAPIGNQSACPS
jgi:hypothetical protein